MKKLYTILLLVISFSGFSQNVFQQGYFIENNGQKIECLIKNIAWKNNPESFEYKLSENEDAKTKTIREVSEFSVNNAYKFKRFNLQIDRAGNSVNNLSHKKEPDWKTETLFLSVLLEGTASLYRYEDNNLVRYFYSTAGGTVQQLLFKEYLSGETIMQNNNYRQQLYNLMKDKFPDTSKYERLKYSRNDLATLFREYNESGNAATDFEKSHNKGSLHLKITPGLSMASVAVHDSYDAYYDFDFDSKAVFRTGLELEYIFPFNNNKWSIFLDPNYQQYSNTAKKLGADYSIEYNYIEIPIGIRHYFYLTGKAKIFINAAYVPSIILGNPHIKTNGVNTWQLSRSSNFALGTGFAYGPYSAEIRYNTSRDILQNYLTRSADYDSFGFVLGYRLF